MKTYFRSYKYTLVCMCLLCLCFLAACGGESGKTNTVSTPVATSGNTTGGAAVGATSPPNVPLGPQPCPAVVSEPSHWDPIVGTESGVNAVGSVTCASLTGNASLQALVISFYEGTGHVADVYVFTNITGPNPIQIFKLQGLYKGNAKISAYNTLLTAEVDQGSSLNANRSNAAQQPDLFREFKWSDGAGTLVPVSFPGIFPNLTRYEAENDQQQVNQGQMTWELDAKAVANRLATTLLNWSSAAPVTVLSGGGPHDLNAMVSVKSTSPGAASITVTLSRLEGNSKNGIWEAIAVTSNGMSITAPQSRDRLNGATTVTGTGNAFEGKIGTVKVLDHLYTTIGNAQVRGASGNGNTTFSTNVSYNASFKGGAQDGLLVLYSYSNADGSIAGAVMLKELLSA